MRHLNFFNTHPYFSSLVGGVIAREEGGKLDRGDFLDDLKHSLMSTFGSIGDELFWGHDRLEEALDWAAGRTN